MEEERKNQNSGMAVGSLVTAIIAFLLAVIPCLGLLAVVPAVIAIVLAIVGLSRSHSNQQGMLVGGLVVAIVALMISVSQGFIMGKLATKSEKWGRNIERVIRDVTEDLEREFGDREVTIRISDDDESVEISTSVERNRLRDRLDELEGERDTLKKEDDSAPGEE